MNPHDREPDDPDLDAALSQLSRTMAPSEGYADRVLGELRTHGVTRPAPRPARMLIAAAWFLAGVGTGAAALSMMRKGPTDVAPMVAAAADIATSTPGEPVQWY
ncbi:MAG: hypothetical protein H7066_02035 [Cytophagaceae bacterium]|nr:hypothetical protein [Gemmatimonadaceae bacterium]